MFKMPETSKNMAVVNSLGQAKGGSTIIYRPTKPGKKQVGSQKAPTKLSKSFGVTSSHKSHPTGDKMKSSWHRMAQNVKEATGLRRVFSKLPAATHLGLLSQVSNPKHPRVSLGVRVLFLLSQTS